MDLGRFTVFGSIDTDNVRIGFLERERKNE